MIEPPHVSPIRKLHSLDIARLETRGRFLQTHINTARSDIDAAFRSAIAKYGWKLEPGAEDILRWAVDRLATIADRPTSPSPIRAFRMVGRKATRRELNKLADQADAVAACVKALHEPAILALADQALMYVPLIRWASEIADRARRANVTNVAMNAGRGRPQAILATFVAALIAGDFEQLTGSRADLPASNTKGMSRGLVPLIKEVFSICAIRADAKAAYRAAISARGQKYGAETD